MTLPKKDPKPRKEKQAPPPTSAHAAATSAVAAMEPPPPFSLVPGSQDFLVASIITTAAYAFNWPSHLGILTLYPELSPGIVAPALGLAAAVMWHRLITVLHELSQSKRQ